MRRVSAPMGGHGPVDRLESRVLMKRSLEPRLRTKERDMKPERPAHSARDGRTRLTRRRFLTTTATALAPVGVPMIMARRASAAGKVILRTIGGSYEEAVVKAIIEPFTKATGIDVVKVPARSEERRVGKECRWRG